MDENYTEVTKRDRSPKFPYISLPRAIDRVKILFEKAKKYDVRVVDIAEDWNLSAKSSSTDRTVAALESYGLIEDSGSGDNRKIKISNTGFRILKDERPGIREALLLEAALKPPIVAEYVKKWEDGRPDNIHALSELQFEGRFTPDAAKVFLRVFDETVQFAMAQPSRGGPDSDSDEEREAAALQKFGSQDAELVSGSGKSASGSGRPNIDFVPEGLPRNEREWLRGPLSKEVGYRLFISGDIGPREIGKLIKLLQAQKSVLEDDD